LPEAPKQRAHAATIRSPDFRAIAHEAATPEEREAHIKSAEIWRQSALRSERLSRQPPVTEYEWVLPSFQQWRRKGSENV
jgi:hypothetical protein